MRLSQENPPFPNKLYHWCSLLTPQQKANTTNQHGARSLFFTFTLFCLVHTFTLSLLFGNFILGFENLRFVSGVESASLVLLLLGSLNLGSVVLNFGFTLGEESSGPAELKKSNTAYINEYYKTSKDYWIKDFNTF